MLNVQFCQIRHALDLLPTEFVSQDRPEIAKSADSFANSIERNANLFVVQRNKTKKNNEESMNTNDVPFSSPS